MFKKLWLILAIFLSFHSIMGSAQNIYDYRISSFHKLSDLSVIPKEYADIDLDRGIKRSEAIEIFLIVAEEDINVMGRVLNDRKNQTGIEWKYTDVLDATKECALAVEASSIGLMQGEYTSNKKERLARMNDFLTWEECLYFATRILSKGYGAVYKRIDEAVVEYESVYPNNEAILMIAEDCGLINQDNVAYSSPFYVNKNELNQHINWMDFVEIIHRMLYIPTEVEGYGGTFYHYRIDSFI